MKPIEINTFFDYHYWAFDKVWACIMQITDEQFTQEIGYSSGSIRNQVLHTLSATRRWTQRLQDAPLSTHPNVENFPDRATVKSEWDVSRLAVMEYLHGLTEEDLSGLVHWELPNRGLVADQPLWQVLLHVANHSTDHRAQILAMLNQQFHVDTPEQDMLFYLLEHGQDRSSD